MPGVSDGERLPDEQTPSGTPVDPLSGRARRLAETRLKTIEALTENQVLVVLTTLSLAVAAFSQSATVQVVSYAVAAATSFLIALSCSVAVKVRPAKSVDYAVIADGVTLVALLVGFMMLALVILGFAFKFEPVATVLFNLLNVIVILFLGVGMIRASENVARMRRERLPGWPKRSRGVYLAIAAGTAAFIGVGVILILPTYWQSPPGWLYLGAIILGAVVLLSVWYINEAGRDLARTVKGKKIDAENPDSLSPP